MKKKIDIEIIEIKKNRISFRNKKGLNLQTPQFRCLIYHSQKEECVPLISELVRNCAMRISLGSSK